MMKIAGMLAFAVTSFSFNAGGQMPADEVKSAVKKLADAENYSWTSNVDVKFGDQEFQIGPTEAKTSKQGPILVSVNLFNTQIEAVVRGEKGAIKTDGGWMSFAEATAGNEQQNQGRFVTRILQNMKPPGADLQELIAKSPDIQKTDDVYAWTLSEDAAKALFRFGRRAGENSPAPKNLKGSAKLWIKEGQLVKYEISVSGTVDANGMEVDVDRKSSVEIKNVGSTKVEIPAEAKAKLTD